MPTACRRETPTISQRNREFDAHELLHARPQTAASFPGRLKTVSEGSCCAMQQTHRMQCIPARRAGPVEGRRSEGGGRGGAARSGANARSCGRPRCNPASSDSAIGKQGCQMGITSPLDAVRGQVGSEPTRRPGKPRPSFCRHLPRGDESRRFAFVRAGCTGAGRMRWCTLVLWRIRGS